VASLFAISDLHVGYRENREVLARLRPDTNEDWLIVAGDIGEQAGDVERVLRFLAGRFSRVLWAPGNHELWTTPKDPVQLRGQERYQHLVAACRDAGVLTPEDPYPVWDGPGGPVAVAPLFVLYDYSWTPFGRPDKESGLAAAVEAGVVCTDEHFLHPDPFPSREEWSWARAEETERRLAELDADLPTVLVSHWPLVRTPTEILRHPEFALWCGTDRTADWHLKYRAAAVVYGHLHIPRPLTIDGVPFHEVSLGYPREWQPRNRPVGLRTILGQRPQPA
jgi:3',5'-cyclic AMP phosphodiesterase CpdA